MLHLEQDEVGAEEKNEKHSIGGGQDDEEQIETAC